MNLTIIEAIDSDALLGSVIKDHSTFVAWRAVFKAIFGLPMTAEEVRIYQECTGRTEPSTVAHQIVWLAIGRRAGKSAAKSLIAVFMAVFRDWQPYLRRGERAVILLVAADREQAKILRRYIGGILETPILKPYVLAETADSIELRGNVVIEVATCSYRTVRGRSVCVALLDEVAFWRGADSTNPDKEVWRAIRASMASFGSAALAVIGSSPYRKDGLLWDGYSAYFGKPDAINLVWQASTKRMNPTISDQFIADEYAADPISAAAEYGAQFRGDVHAFLPRDVVEATVPRNVTEIPFSSEHQYIAFTDPAGGSGTDSMTLAIAHAEGDGVVLDLVDEIRPPFSPERAVKEFAAVLKGYKISSVIGDRYAGEWPRERFSVHGIKYVSSEKTRSDLYLELLPLINAGRAQLLHNPRLISQLVGLERRTGRSGKDFVDHGPGNSHDDVANAAAGALAHATSLKRAERPKLYWGGVSVGPNRNPGSPAGTYGETFVGSDDPTPGSTPEDIGHHLLGPQFGCPCNFCRQYENGSW